MSFGIPVRNGLGIGLRASTALSTRGGAATALLQFIAVAHATSPFITAYPWSSSTGFGAKFTNPATLPTGQGNGVAFTPSGNAIAVAHQTSPLITKIIKTEFVIGTVSNIRRISFAPRTMLHLTNNNACRHTKKCV